MARVADARVRARGMVPVAEWSTEFCADLREHHSEYLQMDVADSTRRTYAAGVRRYMLFCDKMGV